MGAIEEIMSVKRQKWILYYKKKYNYCGQMEIVETGTSLHKGATGVRGFKKGRKKGRHL